MIKTFSLLTKYAAGVLQQQLGHLEINRYFSPFLIIAQHNGQLTPQQLSEKLQTSKPIVSRIIQHLTSIGYVERRSCSNDRRCSYLHLTEKGQLHIDEVKKAFNSMNEKCMQGMTEAQQRQLLDLMDVAKENLRSTDHHDINFDYS